MAANDLRQRIRDKSVFIFSLLVPLALMGVLNLSFGGVDTGNAGLKPAVVGRRGGNRTGPAEQGKDRRRDLHQ